jgi:hypothetical protein
MGQIRLFDQIPIEKLLVTVAGRGTLDDNKVTDFKIDHLYVTWNDQ